MSNINWNNATVNSQLTTAGISALGNIYTAFQASKTQSILAKAQQEAAKHKAWLASAQAAMADMNNDRRLEAAGIEQRNIEANNRVAEQVNNVRSYGVAESNEWFYKQQVDSMRNESNRQNRALLADSSAGTVLANSMKTSTNLQPVIGSVIQASKTMDEMMRNYKLTKNKDQGRNMPSNFQWG